MGSSRAGSGGNARGRSSLARRSPRTHPGFMSTNDDIAKLQAQIDGLHAQQVDLRKQLAKAQLDQWQARFEDLEVQMHLGAKEATDKVMALMDQLRAEWADARRQFEESIANASSVADTVRTGMERAYHDLRAALLESKDKLGTKNRSA